MSPQPHLPLYKPSAHSHPSKYPVGGHLGLWYFKFFNQWNANFSKIHEPDKVGKYKGGKVEWLILMPELIGDQSSLEEAKERLKILVDAQGGKSIFFSSQERLAVGLGYEHPIENGLAFHPTLGVPFIPGSSVKGLIRAWAEQWVEFPNPRLKLADLQRIFGSDAKEPRERSLSTRDGTVIFLDALPIEPVTLEPDIMTPHYGPWYASGEAPADWHSPTPIPFLTVAAEAKFQFCLLPNKPSGKSDVERCAEWLEEALLELGIGAKTAVGYGRMVKYNQASLDQAERFFSEDTKAAELRAELGQVKAAQLSSGFDGYAKRVIELAEHSASAGALLARKLLLEVKLSYKDRYKKLLELSENHD
jgi:CRISPR-associated protein Cmr6